MRRIAVLAMLLACLPVAAAVARQIVQQGHLRVTFEGRLQPRALPRERDVPVTVQLGGSVRTTDGSNPPQLRELTIAMNRAGRVSVAGLPSCQASELQQTSTKRALAVCRGALVGHGHFAANVDFPGAPAFPARGAVLVFNASRRGHMGLLLHLYGSTPVRAAFVLPFNVSRRAEGPFGTVFSTHLPRLASDLGYVTDIDLTIGRRYRYEGRRRSFISASCAAPDGFPGALYRLAEATFDFAGGTHLVSNLPSDCRVR
jgi:hypothetical protein